MSSTNGSRTPSSHHHHNGRRIRQFLRPDGRRVHVAHSPEDAVRLKSHLESTNEPFDIYIHGSPEHVRCLFTTDLRPSSKRGRGRVIDCAIKADGRTLDSWKHCERYTATMSDGVTSCARNTARHTMNSKRFDWSSMLYLPNCA